MTDVLAELNEDQCKAVTYGEGPLMVLAGAGSGKTRVITRRIAHLLQQGVQPSQILALTFTNKAAQEMAYRVEAQGGFRVHVSTFHSACARFLRQDGHLLGYPRDFSIYDTYDRNACIKSLMKSLDLDEGTARPADVGRRISRLKNVGMRPDDMISGMSSLDAIVGKLYRPYEERMLALGAMDFDDLLLRFVDLLQEHEAIAQIYQQRYRWILVDEFQDTNLVQYKLLRLLGKETSNICVVGDPDQSIYRFRGAELRNILDFENDYPDTQIIRLQTNYRSTACILGAAQAVIENNQQRMEKELLTEAEFGSQLQLLRCNDAITESKDIARHLMGLLNDGMDPDQCAVFYRAHFLSRLLEQSLRHMGLPYKVVGGLSFFERREIKDLIAYLRVLVNPLDDVSLERIINVPPRGIGKVSVQKLRKHAEQQQMSLSEVVRDPAAPGLLSGKAKKGVQQLAAVLEAVTDQSRAADVLQVLLEESNYLQYAGGLGEPEDEARLENVGELLNDAAQYDSENGEGLAAYLHRIGLMTSEDRQQSEGPRISLMTVHSAKGLEFHHVVVMGLEEGIFPHQRSLLEPSDLEEERRLMYVALTRARKTVLLSYSRARMVAGMTNTQSPSRFLAEIPDEYVDRGASAWDAYDVHEEESEYDMDTDIEMQPLYPGSKVIHKIYGPGEVLRVNGMGSRTQVVVRFKDAVDRTLLPDHEAFQVLPEGECFDG